MNSRAYFVTTLLLFRVMTWIPVAHAAFMEAAPDLFVCTDTCNAYLLRDGETALLIDLGDGGVLDHLGEIGVKKVEWLLLTGHHRELLQGVGRLDRTVTRIAAPLKERDLLETPNAYRKWQPLLPDTYAVYGASYVRPPQSPVKVDRTLAADEDFEWHGRHIRCLATPGHSPGGMSYVVKIGDDTHAFIGGLMHDGAKMTDWFDTEWDYGFAGGIDALATAVDRLIAAAPKHAHSAQGPTIHDATAQLQRYRAKLDAFRTDYVRGYPVNNLSKRPPHPATRPTPAGPIVQVTPHLYMFGPEMAGKNFAIVIADSGHALLLDCGLFPKSVLNKLIGDMQTHLGLKRIDACWISHMHGDHYTLFAALKEHGVEFWTLDSIVDKCENPLAYDHPALIGAYNVGIDRVKIDRAIKSGDVIDWEGYKLHVDWMPGQTEFGNALWLELDGKRIVFTGDNLFGDPSDPTQNGHECVVARNSSIFEEGYLLGSKYLQTLKPDIIMGAHGVLMTDPAAFVDRYRAWAERIVAHYKDLLPDPDYAYLYDPFWVSAYPYRVDLTKEDTQAVHITVRNHRSTEQKHRIALKLLPGMQAAPAILEGTVAPKSRQTYTVKLTVTDRAAIPPGVQIVPFDITLDAHRYGELFDFVFRARE